MMLGRWYVPDLVRFVLRLPPDLHTELKKWADAEDRSLHSLLIWIIRGALRDKRPNN